MRRIHEHSEILSALCRKKRCRLNRQRIWCGSRRVFVQLANNPVTKSFVSIEVESGKSVHFPSVSRRRRRRLSISISSKQHRTNCYDVENFTLDKQHCRSPV